MIIKPWSSPRDLFRRKDGAHRREDYAMVITPSKASIPAPLYYPALVNWSLSNRMSRYFFKHSPLINFLMGDRARLERSLKQHTGRAWIAALGLRHPVRRQRRRQPRRQRARRHLPPEYYSGVNDDTLNKKLGADQGISKIKLSPAAQIIFRRCTQAGASTRHLCVQR